MRLTRLKFRGLSKRFRGATPVDIDFEALGPGLIALVGGNGQGKTTTMEAPAIALFQKMPTRPGSHYDWAQRADSFVETEWRDGDRHVGLKLLIDPSKKSTEGYFTLDGQPLGDGGKLGPYNELRAEYFGSWDLFLAAPYAAQNKIGNFLTMPKGERKQLFAELIGLAELERVAKWAGAEGTRSQIELSKQEGKIQTLLQALAGKEEAERALELAEAQLSATEVTLRRAQEEVEQARGRLEAAKGAEQELTRLQARYKMANDAQGKAEQAYHRAVEEQARQGSRFQAQLSQARDALEDLNEEALLARLERAGQAFDKRRKYLEGLLAEQPTFRQASDALVIKQAELARLREAVEDRRAIERELLEANHAYSRAEQDLRFVRSNHEALLGQLSGRTELLDKVPCTEEAEWLSPSHERVPLATTCPLLANAQAAKGEAEKLRGRSFKLEEEALAEAKAKVDRAQTKFAAQPTVSASELQLAESAIAELQKLASRLPQVEEWRRDLASLEEERRTAEASGQAELETLRSARARAQERLSALEEDSRTSEREAEAVVKRALDAKSEARLAAADAEEELREARQKLDSASTAELELSQARARCAEIEHDAGVYRDSASRARATLSLMTAQEEELKVARAEQARYSDELADWTLIERGFGKDGIQALEIDAAGPEVARIANELLETCFGPQYSIAFETLRELKTKRGQFSEVFDIKVFDGGEERLVEWLCGGEKVVVGEAIGLALAIFNARKSGVRWETLFRDETSGALEPEWADRYVVMLRRALALGPFFQVIFVSHQPRVYQAADVMLEVKNGQIKPAALQVAA